jgi:hypothetical protein
MKKSIKEFYITKASGEQELFDIQKLKRSLKNAGASVAVVEKIVAAVYKNVPFETAKAVYHFARKQIAKYSKGVAGRYKLKNALRELGPTGYPFEKFIGHVLEKRGFSVKTNRVVKGFCISHEIDVMAQTDHKILIVECKFHNKPGLKTNVRVPLYMKSRFEDIKKWYDVKKRNREYKKKAYYAKLQPEGAKYSIVTIVTNTKFTKNAIRYAKCVGIELLGWAWPKKGNLEQLIDKLKAHPITVLSSLTKHQKEFLLSKDVVMCFQLEHKQHLLKKLKIKTDKITQILDEAKAVCKLCK